MWEDYRYLILPQGLKNVADLLNQKASAEHATEFKNFLLELNRKISETYESGFLGIGRKKKKKREETIQLVSNALEA